MTRLAGVGLFVVGGLVLFAAALFMVGDRRMAFARTFRVATQFSRVTGLQPGAVVRVSGARAGTIRRIDPPTDPAGRFRVELDITEELHPLVRTDSVASIEAEGLVGGSFLSIEIGGADAPIATSGTMLPSREPFEIADMLQQMGATIVKVNATVDVLTGQVQHALDSVVVTVDNANALITSVSDDATRIASAGARISTDLADLTADIRDGDGTVAKLLHDDTLYRRLAAAAEHGEAIAGDTRQIVGDTRQIVGDVRAAVERLRGTDGQVTGLIDELRQTVTQSRSAVSGFADNMDALKRNFLFRGFFNRRGYFDLDAVSPDDYRKGVLTGGGERPAVRIWLTADRLFAPAAEGAAGTPVLTDDGQARLDSAMTAFLDQLPGGVLVVEGYSRDGSRQSQFRTARGRAATVRDYLVDRFGLDAQRSGAMPLGATPVETPELASWSGEGIALAYFSDPARR